MLLTQCSSKVLKVVFRSEAYGQLCECWFLISHPDEASMCVLTDRASGGLLCHSWDENKSQVVHLMGRQRWQQTAPCQCWNHYFKSKTTEERFFVVPQILEVGQEVSG